MPTSDTIQVENAIREAEAKGEEIDDGTARTIASWYADGSDTVTMAFVSTGAILESGSNVYRHLTHMQSDGSSLYDKASPADKRALDFLGTYLVNAGERGPVEGWADKWPAALLGHEPDEESAPFEVQSRILYLRVLGHIWMPKVQAAAQETINEGEFDRLDIDPSDPDDIRTYCDTHFGDFSSIDAIDAELVEVGPSSTEAKQDGWVATTTYRRTVHVLQFSEEEDMVWVDCMFPSEEEEEES